MTCSNRGVGSYGGNNYGGRGNCVNDTIKRILDAQQRATDHCVSSCDTAIDDLLSPSQHHRPHRYDTIPFMLFTKDCVKPFVGSGFTSWQGRDAYRRGNFRCVESSIFKVKGFKKGDDNCVTLELLEPRRRSRGYDNAEFEGENQVESGHGHGHGHGDDCGCSVCKRYGDHYFDSFCLTGICITVDLDCFCGISCLDPVRAESVYD